MTKPIAPWDSKVKFPHPNLVWFTYLDERYQIEVHRNGESSGTLFIFDHNNNDEVVSSSSVTFIFDAKFGPDSESVAEWQKLTLEAVDKL